MVYCFNIVCYLSHCRLSLLLVADGGAGQQKALGVCGGVLVLY